MLMEDQAKSYLPTQVDRYAYQAPAGVTNSFCGHQDAGTARHASDMAPIQGRAQSKAKHMPQVLRTRSLSLQDRLQLAPGLGYFNPG